VAEYAMSLIPEKRRNMTGKGVFSGKENSGT